MNFNTYERAYCLYPLETLDKSTSLLLVEKSADVNFLMVKYAVLGIRFKKVAYDDEFRHKEMRWVEDSYSLRMELPSLELGDDESDEEGVIDPIRLTSWSLSTSPGDMHRMHFRMMSYSPEEDVYPIPVCSFTLKKTIDLACIFGGFSPKKSKRFPESGDKNS